LTKTITDKEFAAAAILLLRSHKAGKTTEQGAVQALFELALALEPDDEIALQDVP